MAAEDTAPVGTFSSAVAPPVPGGGADTDQLMQWLMSVASGGGMGGMGTPPGIMGGGNPVGIGMDALGLGGGGLDPLGMGAASMINPMSGAFGLNPYQAAGLRLKRNNMMNALRQNMANQHRSIGAAGGRDYSRHVENIDDEILALQEQKIQDNVKNALAYNQQLMQYGQQNFANNQALSNKFAQVLKDMFTLGGASEDGGSHSTFSGAEGDGDTQGTLP